MTVLTVPNWPFLYKKRCGYSDTPLTVTLFSCPEGVTVSGEVCIAPGWRAWGRNPSKGRDQILPSGNLEVEPLLLRVLPVGAGRGARPGGPQPGDVGEVDQSGRGGRESEQRGRYGEHSH